MDKCPTKICTGALIYAFYILDHILCVGLGLILLDWTTLLSLSFKHYTCMWISIVFVVWSSSKKYDCPFYIINFNLPLQN
jgi:hypothetical protein